MNSIKSANKLDQMTIDEKKEYFNELKSYILSLPFDYEELDKGEKKFIQTVDFIVPKFKKYFEPNISIKTKEIPETFILVSNHLGSLDQILLSVPFLGTAFHYMIAESLMEIRNLKIGQLYLNRGAFVVDRTSQEGRKMAIPNALKYLYRDKNVALFPEASRQIRYGSDGSVQHFKNGAVMLAQMSGVPIIPVAINNDFSKNSIYINVGEKFNVNLEDKITMKNVMLREKVNELWQENKDNGAKILTKKK